MTPPPISFFDRDAVSVAQALIGATLIVRGTAGAIVESEAYTLDDPASHSFPGRTVRNAAMFGAPAHAYVYRSYGVHLCLNVVCRSGEAVLIRAVQPLIGVSLMQERRKRLDERALCSGPGKLTQAMGVLAEDDHRPFLDADFSIQLAPPLPPDAILTGPRIGISKAADRAWRFGLRGSTYLSRSFPSA